MSSVCFVVPEGFVTPSFFASATAEETARVLEIAARIPEWIATDTTGKMQDIFRVVEQKERERVQTIKDRLHTLEQENVQLRIDKEQFVLQSKTHMEELRHERKAHEKQLQEQEVRIRHSMKEETYGEADKLHETLRIAQEKSLEMERSLNARLRACMESDMLKDTDLHKLKLRVAELESPMGRGQTGELDVAQTLRDVGYRVCDTSHGGDKGFLDLLVTPDGAVEGCNLRLAVEVKNRKDVKRENLDTFHERVLKGLASNLYDAAVFVSIRSCCRKGPHAVEMEMYLDEAKRPLVPVTWIGPEKGKGVPPLSQEQLETHVHMQMALLSQCHTIRRELCNGIQDVDLQTIQHMVDTMSGLLNEAFVDLSKQTRLIDELKSNTTAIRVRCIHMCSALFGANQQVPWLGRSLPLPWMEVYQRAKEKATASMKDSDIWNHLSGTKNIVERSIGKEAMFTAIRQSLKRPLDE